MKPNYGSDATEHPTKAYATAQIDDVMTLDDFTKHIAAHGSVYGRGDIYNVLAQAVDCLKEMILNGKKVKLGDLGDFYPVIESTGANTKEDFTADNITRLTVNWTRGEILKNMIGETDLRYVATRAAQSAVAAAERKTSATSFSVTVDKRINDVNFSDADDDSGSTSDNTSSGGSDSGSGSGSDSGSDSGSGSGSDSGSDSGSGMEGE